jgi:tRNA pseudouridine55 synthase
MQKPLPDQRNNSAYHTTDNIVSKLCKLMINGVLIVNKPKGMTSHDVVNNVRRLFKMRRVGHTGTLDPLATGVLVILLGYATRLSQFMLQNEKRYRGTIRLGIETATYDADGKVVAVKPVNVELDAIRAVITGFQGDIKQVPPMYSALKVDGQKLYALARQGKTIPREPRDVTIHYIEVLRWQPPDLDLDVQCSAGTYIRSLAHDIGTALGCGAHLRTLVRTASHGFTLAESYTLDALEGLMQEGSILCSLLPPRVALGKMPSVNLTPEQVVDVSFGRKIALSWDKPASVLQALDAHENLVAVMLPAEDGYWQPKVVIPVAIQETE